jgi:hypothetical protein
MHQIGRMCDMHTHYQVAEAQFGAKTRVTERAEKENKEASGAATWRRDSDISSHPSGCTGMQVGGPDETWARYHFERLNGAPSGGNFWSWSTVIGIGVAPTSSSGLRRQGLRGSRHLLPSVIWPLVL